MADSPACYRKLRNYKYQPQQGACTTTGSLSDPAPPLGFGPVRE